jgi:hypothetical protein
MANEKIQIVTDLWVRKLSKSQPYLQQDDTLVAVLREACTVLIGKSVEITGAILDSIVEQNKDRLNWKHGAAVAAEAEAKAKADELARRRLRESLGYVRHGTELDRISQSERTGQGSGIKSENLAETAKRMEQERSNKIVQAKIDSAIQHGSYHHNFAEKSRREATLNAINNDKRLTPLQRLAKIEKTVADYKD